jgi:hypothetical protein
VLSHHLPGHEEGAHTGTFGTKKATKISQKIPAIFEKITDFSFLVEIMRGIFRIF